MGFHPRPSAPRYVVEAPLDVQEEAEYVSWSGEAGAASINACNAEEQNPEILAIGNVRARSAQLGPETRHRRRRYGVPQPRSRSTCLPFPRQAVFRQQILPRVAASVNNAEVFKELRYIFYWRVLAEWFDRMHPEHYADIQVRRSLPTLAAMRGGLTMTCV